MLDALLIILVAAALVLIAAALFRSLLDHVTVYEFERGLRYDKGKFTGVVEPGQYWIYRPGTRVDKFDIRPRVVAITGQEVITSDGVSLRLSLVAEYGVVDPAVAVNSVESFDQSIYVAAQLALRKIVGSAPLEQLLEHRDEIGPKVAEQVAPQAEALGLDLKQVEVRDIMFTGELRRTFAQVVAARQEGLAALERARGETAALRSLANAARMMEGNPALMHLRLLQQLGASGGNTIVLGLPSTTTPLPVPKGEGSQPPELSAEPE